MTSSGITASSYTSQILCTTLVFALYNCFTGYNIPASQYDALYYYGTAATACKTDMHHKREWD